MQEQMSNAIRDGNSKNKKKKKRKFSKLRTLVEEQGRPLMGSAMLGRG